MLLLKPAPSPSSLLLQQNFVEGSGQLHTLACRMSSGAMVGQGRESLPVRSWSGGVGRSEILPKGDDAAEPARLVRHRAGDVLGLVALTVRSHDELARHRGRSVGTQMRAHDMQAGVYGRGRANRGQDVPVVEVERGRLDAQPRSSPSQLVDHPPMSHDVPAVGQPAVDQRESAQAQSRDACRRATSAPRPCRAGPLSPAERGATRTHRP